MSISDWMSNVQPKRKTRSKAARWLHQQAADLNDVPLGQLHCLVQQPLVRLAVEHHWPLEAGTHLKNIWQGVQCPFRDLTKWLQSYFILFYFNFFNQSLHFWCLLYFWICFPKVFNCSECWSFIVHESECAVQCILGIFLLKIFKNVFFFILLELFI